VDWKKLNRKATFKMAYKARSFKIQDVLKKMLQTFTINLNEAKSNEASAQAEYEKLMMLKGSSSMQPASR
jgi:restriction endonuclease